ncbi:EamA family transporter RarD [Zoogloea sp.]|uniref:EamA family transporter RarD n=1 Tax=Zoogloea sp. TaxID=49181 RepID=UPI00261CAE17|nr:EamA family transporter RarD [Zoogloea sp.]MDD3354228.1 EamA family transporter RarD [Zoogloea sp.]
MDSRNTLAGIAFGLGAYGIWGFFPLFFRQLGHVSPIDLLSNRALWGCVFVALILSVRRQWGATLAAARRPGTLLRLALAAVLVASNWLAFLWAVDQRQVVASSLGYFLTPLFNVVLGMLVLKERLNGKEWASVGLAVAAVGCEFLTLGSLPWISLFIGASFGFYGLVRKQVPVNAISGLWLETLTMLPLIGLYTLWQSSQGQAVFTGHDALTQGLLLAAGVVTALPLMLFAAATQRLNLATVGMLMYINPTLQFLTAILVFDEPLQPARLFTFALIWAGLGLYSWSGWQKYRAARAV